MDRRGEPCCPGRAFWGLSVGVLPGEQELPRPGEPSGDSPAFGGLSPVRSELGDKDWRPLHPPELVSAKPESGILIGGLTGQSWRVPRVEGAAAWTSRHGIRAAPCKSDR